MKKKQMKTSKPEKKESKEKMTKKEMYVHKGMPAMVVRKAMSTEEMIARMKKVK